VNRLPVIVIGAGGHAKVAIDALLRRGVGVIGCVDSDPARYGDTILGVPVLGGDDEVREYAPDSVRLINGLGTIAVATSRRALFLRFKDMGYSFAGIVHPSAVVADSVILGEGAQIMAGAVIQPGVRIGDNAIINTRASVDHDCTISDHVHIAPGCAISGGVTIGEASHIGCGAVIIQGLSIGRECVIGAGAAVIGDVEPGTTVMGVPARITAP